MKKLMIGNEAVARGLYEGGVRVVEHRGFDAKQPLCVAICRAK